MANPPAAPPVDVSPATDRRVRVEAKQQEMRKRLSTLGSDKRPDAVSAKAKLQLGLAELDGYIRDGWDRVSDAASVRIDAWLARQA